MTTPSSKKNLSQVLWSNAEYSGVTLSRQDFVPTNRGHGIFVRTLGDDILYDLRLAQEKPFLGHTHPLTIQHNYGELKKQSLANHFSVTRQEFTRMLETFQKVHITELLSESFEFSCNNIVITIDESALELDFKMINKRIEECLSERPDYFFWIVEKDITLSSHHNIFKFFNLHQYKNIHLCLKLHFINSVYIVSHHMFFEDSNISLFNGLYEYYEKIVASHKNKKDFAIIDQFIKDNDLDKVVNRKGRYLIFAQSIDEKKFIENGIITSSFQTDKKTILAIPIACTKGELTDCLLRVKESI